MTLKIFSKKAYERFLYNYLKHVRLSKIINNFFNMQECWSTYLTCPSRLWSKLLRYLERRSSFRIHRQELSTTIPGMFQMMFSRNWYLFKFLACSLRKPFNRHQNIASFLITVIICEKNYWVGSVIKLFVNRTTMLTWFRRIELNILGFF